MEPLLTLHNYPNLRSRRQALRYRAGWQGLEVYQVVFFMHEKDTGGKVACGGKEGVEFIDWLKDSVAL